MAQTPRPRCRPLDAVVALPLVLLDIWVGPGPSIDSGEERIYEATFVRLVAEQTPSSILSLEVRMRCHGLALLGAAIGATPLRSQTASGDTMPAAVVQRFVDAANAADVNAMMATVAPDAAFATLPGGQPLATGRDSVRALYERMFARQAGVTVKVESRLADGAFAVDHEPSKPPTGRPRVMRHGFTT